GLPSARPVALLAGPRRPRRLTRLAARRTSFRFGRRVPSQDCEGDDATGNGQDNTHAADATVEFVETEPFHIHCLPNWRRAADDRAATRTRHGGCVRPFATLNLTGTSQGTFHGKD
ncbi:hypothetical protein LXM94_22895, partial [Rhizobium sp. TRM95111]|uniref:hypothetical protein n=1 Tax=Rhizobium alarense TaxID=2846851 RepID=UPI001F3919C1